MPAKFFLFRVSKTSNISKGFTKSFYFFRNHVSRPPKLMEKLENERLAFQSVNANTMNFRDLFESLSVMFYVENFIPTYELEYISPAFENLGYTLEEIYSDPKLLDRITHPDDLKKMREANKEIYEGIKCESDYEYRVYCKNGEMRWLKDRGRPIFNEKGERVKWFGVLTDITSQKQTEQKLRESTIELEYSNREYGELNESFKKALEDLQMSQAELLAAHDSTNLIMDSMVDFVIVVDMDLTMRRVNPATLKLCGYEEHEMLGQSVNILMPDRPFGERAVNALRRRGFIQNIEKLSHRKDGTIIPVSLSMCVLKDEHGNESGIVGVGKDISDIVKAREDLERSNEKLRQSNRELQDFAYVASHDLQEPLRKIRAFGDRLERKFTGTLGDEGADYINRMQNAAGRMQTLINDLLIFSRVATKIQPFQETDINQIAQDVVSDLEIRIEETKGHVEIQEMPVIDADPLQMRQLFQNLIGNALKFHRHEEPPRIKISSNLLESKDDIQINGLNYSNGNKKMCRIVVQDNGIGFDEKYLDRIFTVFQRLHGRGTYEGSGIGLSVCRKIVERHGGEITARSQPDQGATFVITLPVKQEQEMSL